MSEKTAALRYLVSAADTPILDYIEMSVSSAFAFDTLTLRRAQSASMEERTRSMPEASDNLTAVSIAPSAGRAAEETSTRLRSINLCS